MSRKHNARGSASTLVRVDFVRRLKVTLHPPFCPVLLQSMPHFCGTRFTFSIFLFTLSPCLPSPANTGNRNEACAHASPPIDMSINFHKEPATVRLNERTSQREPREAPGRIGSDRGDFPQFFIISISFVLCLRVPCFFLLRKMDSMRREIHIMEREI